MYVCVCNAITDKQIREAAKAGARDLCDLQAELGVASNCGSCAQTATEILTTHRRSQQLPGPQHYVPSIA